MRKRHTIASASCRSLLILTLFAVLFAPVSARADTPIGSSGELGGQYRSPSGMAVDPVDELLYVADTGNHRVDVFTVGGAFVRAFGWGVVKSGPGNVPKNDIQKVEVKATGGRFSLLFVQISSKSIGPFKQETASIERDATSTGPGSVQSALEGLQSIEPGDVAVSGPPGGPWNVEFVGSYADEDIHVLEEGSASELTGGAASLAITTVQDGAAFEVCEASAGDVCREGQLGAKLGQMNPQDVAVDPATHEIYVFDGLLDNAGINEPSRNRVQKFTSAGKLVYVLGGDVDQGPNHPGNFCTPAFITEGDVCIGGRKGHSVVGVDNGAFFRADSVVRVGPGGVLYVQDETSVQKFSPAGAFLDEVVLPGNPSFGFAVDASGRLYSATQNETSRYSSAGVLEETVSTMNRAGVAVDAAENLFVTNTIVPFGNPGAVNGVSRFSPALATTQVFYAENGSRLAVLVPYSSVSGDIFAMPTAGGIVHIPFPPPGPVVYPLPSASTADPIGNVKATLRSRINPEGKATTFHYQYLDQQAFEAGGYSNPALKTTSESSPIGSDFLLHDAVQQITGLTPDTVYHFRAVAKNADGSDRLGPDSTFKTAPPLQFGASWVTGVSTDTASLHAELNPFGFAATAYFAYVDDATFGTSGFTNAQKAPAGAPLDFGSGEAFTERSAIAYPLSPGTTYHYRLVASDHCKPAEPAVICTFEGPVRTFTTFAPSKPSPTICQNAALREGAATFLPDCRAYEMVSPVDKNGANVEVVFNITGYRAGLDQAAPDGETLTYSAYKSFATPESAPYTSQYLARRGSEGWQSESISPQREGPTFYNSAGLDYQFKAFTADLCQGWPLQDTALSLAPGSVPGFPNLYHRDNCEPGVGAYEALTTAEPPNLQPRDFFPELQGFSADGKKAFFAATDKLTANAKKGVAQVYEAEGGTLELVCVLPNGKVSSVGCSLGTNEEAFSSVDRNANLSHAVSADGSRVFWTLSEGTAGKIYVRINGTETVAVSESVSTGDARFWGAAVDGSSVVFTSGSNLHRFDVDSKTQTLIAEGVTGVAGMSEDASRIFFVSTKVLASGALAGQPNLYLNDGAGTKFIATLPSDQEWWTPDELRPIERPSRVTPDGQQFVFMSTGSLTGYDNLDADTGEADAEVFLYDASANSGAGELVCVSCNPSGARPVGRELGVAGSGDLRAAAWIPPWQNQLYASRVISDDGSRIYFNSYDALLGRDTNGKQDVYQWERQGAGDCTSSSATFQASSGGCLGLISTGDSPVDSELVDSDATGEDVFFKTMSSLAQQDPDLLDIYDAREGAGFPPPPSPPAECEGEACQHPSSPPQSPTPASSTYVGPANPTNKPKKCPKGKHKVKKNGKTQCAKNKPKGSKNKNKNKNGRAAK